MKNWKEISGFPEYLINKKGEVKSLKNGKVRILKSFLRTIQ